MSIRFQAAFQSITVLLQVADRAGLLKPEERELILDPNAFLGVSYATIYRRLGEAMILALASRYEDSLPSLADEWSNVEPHLCVLLDCIAERVQPPPERQPGLSAPGDDPGRPLAARLPPHGGRADPDHSHGGC